jgi:hypothetical protein
LRIPRWSILLALAAVVTVLNAVKPLQVDDAAYYYYARQISQHPFDPYGFEIFWYQHPLPANHVLAPPVIPYWWAAGIRVFGDHPFLWKLWLFPFAWLFVVALHAIFQRFATPNELPLTCMTVFSPVFLPSLNYMLDVPAMALGLASLAVYFRAMESRDWWLAALAGLLAGLAMQTKYTAFLVPATIVLYTAVYVVTAPGYRRAALVLLRLLAVVVAAAVFTGWECLIASEYGDSHFMLQVRNDNRNLSAQLELFSVPLLLLLGGTAPWIGVFGVAAMTRRIIPVLALGTAIVVAFVVTATMGSSTQITFHHLLPIPSDWKALLITREQVIYFALGVFTLGTMSVVAFLLLWRGRFRDSAGWFVVLWFVLEIAGYFALTPFPAVRRVMGIVIVGTILTGRLAANLRPSMRWGIATAQIALGLMFCGVDSVDAWAAKNTAEGAAAHVRLLEPHARIHFTGHWGFQFYSERAGMMPVVPDDPSKPIRRGDWLVVPHRAFEQQVIRLDPATVVFRTFLEIDDVIPLRTVRAFYGSSSGAPLEHRDGPRFVATIYQATQEFVPRSP